MKQLILWLTKTISSFFLRGGASNPAPDLFVRRLDSDDIAGAVAKVLGRRLTSFEADLLTRELRPLRDADDTLFIRVASPRYEGRAPIVMIRSLAVDGYAAEGNIPLQVIESALVFREHATLEDGVIDLVA